MSMVLNADLVLNADTPFDRSKDFGYLFRWAAALSLTEVMSQAIVAAGLTTEP
ncbi:hypothetical protein H6F86_30855 [Phormidium sp. FACHB-592]|uniref:Uncharacterized protein n=1 Tax=Stenomitos frigidus AS-A4 TaxID=2933935 RepID=A0ABV0KRS3_9CYAN|nr:hypothetical protein [Phormidium sp. FACHB-592]MBD2078213.1 hypothetical protein [Phormidium sp. FACHB-592]